MTAPAPPAPPVHYDPTYADPTAVAGQLRTATAAAYCAETAARLRDPHQLSMSTLGGCTRQGAYKLAGTPVSDVHPPREGRGANLGTWIHAGLLPRLAAELPGGRYEVPVVLRAAGIELPGTADIDWDGGIFDLKTVREHGLSRALVSGEPASASHRVQGAGYALARVQEGRPCPTIAWSYMDRASGEDAYPTWRFENRHALEVVDRVEEIVAAAADPDAARRDEPGPGLSYSCDECPWLRRCWGEDAEPGQVGAQASTVRSDPEVAEALLDYVRARAAEKEAEKTKKFAEARLSRTPYGTYGPVPDRPDAAVSYRRSQGWPEVDRAAAAARLRELGEEPPMRDRRGNLMIKVVPAERQR